MYQLGGINNRNAIFAQLMDMLMDMYRLLIKLGNARRHPAGGNVADGYMS